MSKIIFLVITITLVVTMLAGCGSKDDEEMNETSADEVKTKGVIGISVLTMTNPFFMEIVENVKDEAAKNGYDVIAVSGELDPARQYQQVKDFIVRRVSAIILTPCDSKAIGSAIQAANKAGIPVFTADIACIADNAKVVSHIATDNYAGGRQAGKAIMQALGNKGKIAIVTHPEVESAQLRVKGLQEELKESNSEIEILGIWRGMGARDESFKVMRDILSAHPDIDGVFAVNDPSAFGVIAALEIVGKQDQVKIVAFDGQPEAQKAIRDGKIYADPIQFPDRIGRQSVQSIMSYLEGEDVPSQILIPPELYYKADAEKDASIKD